MSASARWLLALSLALLALALGVGPAAAAEAPRTSVINGVEAPPGSFPYLAFIVFEAGEEAGACSGTVVAANVVLTAAHCVLNEDFSAVYPPSDFIVVTGTVDWASSERTVSSVSQVAVSPAFAYLKPSYTPVRGDAAVLRLAAPVTAPSVRLASTRTWAPGTAVTMAGWGLTDVLAPAPTVVHYGEAAVQSDEYCKAEFGYFQAGAQLCALDAPAHEYTTCSGDSGGPLLMAAPGSGEPLEIGITSIGGVGCPTDEPAFFTRVDAVAGWVQQKIAEYGGQPAPEPAPVAPPRLATLTGARARALALALLRERLGGQFRAHRGLRVGCAKLSRTRRRCAVFWTAGDREYRGAVTVFYAFAEGAQVVYGRFTIRRLSRRCLRLTGSQAACTTKVLRG